MTCTLFRCDGSRQVGLGHIVRSLALADELHKNHGCKVVFAMRESPIGFDMIGQKGYGLLIYQGDGSLSDYDRWIKTIIKDENIQLLVLDVRDDLPINTVRDINKDYGVLIVTIDDPSDRRLLADLAFYPPVPQVKSMDWNGFNGELYVGWEWVILRPEFIKYKNAERRTPNAPLPKILVTMGGSDRAGLTYMAVDALGMISEEFEGTVVVGPGFKDKEALSKIISEMGKDIHVVQSPGSIAQIMLEADLAIASFGVTAYELAAMGVPAIYLCLTEDHAKSAAAFVEAGIAKNIGIYTIVTQYELSEAIRRLLIDMPDRLKMSKRASQLVDGRGSERIARIVMDRMRDKHG